MPDPIPSRPPQAGPSVAPPPKFVDRRRQFRREADRIAHEETRLLARALDILVADRPAEGRLAGVLDLLAETVGADRAALVAEGAQRRVAVVARGTDDEPAARDLAVWLDAAAPRSRARRAAAGPAPISVVHAPSDHAPSRHAPSRREPRDHVPCDHVPGDHVSVDAPSFELLTIPSAGDVTLGFAFARPIPAGTLAERLPPAMARHAAVALALVTDALATARELSDLRAREAERDHYVSTVAHELRTPLTGLSGYLDLILDGRVEDPAIEREFLERGRTIVASMTGLVGDLLEMSRLDAGSVALARTPFSVAEAMSAVASGLLPIALERRVDLRVDPPPRIRTATGDRRRVEQILTNLAGNALKFGRSDGRGVVELRATFDGVVALLSVHDDGAGIEVEDRPRIFERFYRMVGHERVTGTGLGLPIARELARAMGGELDVASLPGTGSTFVLALPTPALGDGDDTSVPAAIARALEIETGRLADAAAMRAGQAARRRRSRTGGDGAEVQVLTSRARVGRSVVGTIGARR